MSIDQFSRIENCIENTFCKLNCEPVEYQSLWNIGRMSIEKKSKYYRIAFVDLESDWQFMFGVVEWERLQALSVTGSLSDLELLRA